MTWPKKIYLPTYLPTSLHPYIRELHSRAYLSITFSFLMYMGSGALLHTLPLRHFIRVMGRHDLNFWPQIWPQFLTSIFYLNFWTQFLTWLGNFLSPYWKLLAQYCDPGSLPAGGRKSSCWKPFRPLDFVVWTLWALRPQDTRRYTVRGFVEIQSTIFENYSVFIDTDSKLIHADSCAWGFCSKLQSLK